MGAMGGDLFITDKSGRFVVKLVWRCGKGIERVKSEFMSE